MDDGSGSRPISSASGRGSDAMSAPVSILKVLNDVFGAAFPGTSWAAWRAFLAAVFGLPMSAAEAATFTRCTGRQAPPVRQVREAWMVVGRRGGKSRIAALLIVYLAFFRTYSLAPGERGVVMVLAADRRQARVIFRYVKALIEAVPMLRELLVKEPTAESIDLTTGISVEIHTSSFRAVRGYTVVACVCDEIAFWPTDTAANPDAEILGALRPALATVPDSLLVGLSSPYARRGELWKAYKAHFGKDDERVLVWQAPTAVMNPEASLGPVIEQAYADDPIVAAAEYGAEFRRDIEAFVGLEVIDAATVPGRTALAPVAGVSYTAFVDPSGGSADSMTMAIGHVTNGVIVVDLVREQPPPFSPEATVESFAADLKRFGVNRVVGDRYAGLWPQERFTREGIGYEASAAPKSDLYRDMLPALTSGRVELPDLPRLRTQLVGLERRTARGGRDSIDHAPGGHDDVANAVAGLVALLAVGRDREAAAAGIRLALELSTEDEGRRESGLFA